MLGCSIIADDHNLSVRAEEMNGCDAVGSGKNSDLFGESGEDLQSFLSLIVIAVLVSKAMHSEQQDRSGTVA